MEYRRGRPDEPSHPGTNVCATTGDVLIDRVIKTDDVGVWSAMFKPGACTYWHSHEDGQLFFVSTGRGVVVSRDGHVQEVGAGDIVHSAPGEVHWHGAAPDCFVTYTSVSLGVTSQQEPVTADEYRSAWTT